MAFFLVFVIPTMVALVMEMYMLLPIKFTYDPGVVVKVKLVDMRVLGSSYTKIILLLPGFEAPPRMNEGIQRVSFVLLALLLLANIWLAHRPTVTSGVVRTPQQQGRRTSAR